MKTFYVYIMTNRNRTLYMGVTSDLERRVYEHKQRLVPGFTSNCNIGYLVYLETFNDAKSAIAREKRIKGWVRAKKLVLIETVDPHWEDLAETWYGPVQDSSSA